VSAVCAACGEARRSFAFEGRDWYVGAASGSWQYFTCARCRSVYADPQPTAAELDAAYAASYGPYSDEPTLLERLGEPLARREAAWLVALAEPTGLLLDVGCGRGTMMRRARESGWTGPIRGFEPSEEVAMHASAKLALPIDVAPVESLPADAGPAKAIILRHVIEHVREPIPVLRTLREHLEPGGIIYVGTPDRRALAARVFGRHWHGYDPPRHLFAFTAGGVREMLRAAGFEPVAERWDFAPQMWAASIHHRLSDSRLKRWAGPMSTLANPLVAFPAGLLGGLEWLLRRTTMYGIAARRVG
jgi:SAM-dependent methyltransferase